MRATLKRAVCPSSACLPTVVRPCGCLKTCMSLMELLFKAEQQSLSLPSSLCMKCMCLLMQTCPREPKQSSRRLRT